MNQTQPGILDPIPLQGRYLFFELVPDADPRASLAALRDLVDGGDTVIGLVPHFALFFALSAARSGQMRGARAQE